MFCDLYAIVEKGRVWVVDKINVEYWGGILKAHKNVKLIDCGGVWRRLWGLIEKDGTYIVWRVRWLVEENGTFSASGGVYFLFLLYIFEVLDGLCVWIEESEKVLVLVFTFWKDFRFFIL